MTEYINLQKYSVSYLLPIALKVLIKKWFLLTELFFSLVQFDLIGFQSTSSPLVDWTSPGRWDAAPHLGFSGR